MNVLTEGHKYELDNFEGDEKQVLQFIEKEPIEEGSTELKTVNDGTTNEEVLDMLINRLDYLYIKVPSEETMNAITNCKIALAELEKRTTKRKAREIKGTNAA